MSVKSPVGRGSLGAPESGTSSIMALPRKRKGAVSKTQFVAQHPGQSRGPALALQPTIKMVALGLRWSPTDLCVLLSNR